MKLLEKIVSIEPSDLEKERIAKALLDPKTPQYRVLTTAGPLIRDHDFWRRAQKTFSVRGFRDGNPKAIQMVIARAIEHVRLHDGRGDHAAWGKTWPLYVRSAHAYLLNELSALHALLANEECQPDSGTLTEKILKAVVKSLPLYDANLGQVRELYEIWGFERTERADDLLANAYVQADALRRVVDSRVGTMRRELASAINTARSDISRSLDRNANDIQFLRAQVEKIRVELDEAVATFSDAARAVRIKPSTESASSAPPRSPSQEHPHEAQIQLQQAMDAIAALRSRVESFGKQLKEIRHRQETGIPIVSQPVAHPRTGTQTTTALEAIQKWSPRFIDAGINTSSVAAAWIVLELFRRSRVLISDKPELFASLMASLPGGAVRRVVASPLWLTETDWKESIAFISVDDGVPKLLIIEDFDVAIQEAYLVPALIGWQSSIGNQCANRVLLIPSDAELRSVSPRILELATLVTHDAVHVRDLGRLASTITDSPPTLEMVHASATVVGYSRTKNVSAEDQLRRYAANCGVSLPARLAENFVSVFDGLRAFLNARDAGYVAKEAILMPWVEHAKGEAVSRTFSEALKRILDAE